MMVYLSRAPSFRLDGRDMWATATLGFGVNPLGNRRRVAWVQFLVLGLLPATWPRIGWSRCSGGLRAHPAGQYVALLAFYPVVGWRPGPLRGLPLPPVRSGTATSPALRSHHRR